MARPGASGGSVEAILSASQDMLRIHPCDVWDHGGGRGVPLWDQRANFISSNGEICRSLVEILSFSEYDPQDESPRLIGVIIY